MTFSKILIGSAFVATLASATHDKDKGTGMVVGGYHGTVKIARPVATPVYSLPVGAIHTQEQYTVSRPSFGNVVGRSPPTYYCKNPDFILDGHQCIRTMAQSIEYVCPQGFVNNGGECQRTTALLRNCPAGFQSRNGQCAQTISAPIQQVCPDNAHEIGPGRCEMEVQAPLTQRCEQGTIRDGRCVFQSFVPALAFCPEGFTMNAGSCVQETHYDCTRDTLAPLGFPTLAPYNFQPAMQSLQFLTRLIPTLPPLPKISFAPTVLNSVVVGEVDQIPSNGGHHQNLRQLSCVKDQATGVCIGEAQPAIITQKTSSVITVQKTCTKVTTTALGFSCTDGVVQGNQCCIPAYLPIVDICLGEGDASHCTRRVPVAAEQVCPPDYVKECSTGNACRCAAVQAAPFLESCPTGYERCGNSCKQVAEMRAICPTGYTMDSETCVRLFVQPADCIFTVEYECDKTKNQCARQQS